MDIEKMHVVFREFAQKMGMQTIRAILDEDIDICLNTAIINTVRQYLLSNKSNNPYINYRLNDTKLNLSIAPINALRTLYSKAVISGDKIKTVDKSNIANVTNPYCININKDVIDCKIMAYTGFKVSYSNNDLYDCRIIEVEDLGSTINDYCNRPTFETPIVTTTSIDDGLYLEIYNGNTSKVQYEKNKFKPIAYLYVTFIKYPKEVKYDRQNSINNIDCDLPEYLHEEVVTNAAQIYLTSIGVNMKTTNNK